MFVSEERLIVDRIKEYIKKEEFIGNEVKIMLRNGHILNIDDYRKMVNSGRINPQDAYVYIRSRITIYKEVFYYLFLAEYSILLNAYLSKLGFYYEDFVAPATDLKYIAGPVNYDKDLEEQDLHEQYLSIEVINLDTVVNNTNLRKIIFEVLGEKLISGKRELTGEEYNKILDMYKSQRLFAGHNFDEVETIIGSYYESDIRPSVKEVSRIATDYYRIFNPYRVCYDMNNWKVVDCSTIT